MRTIVGFAVINACTFALDLGIVTLAHGVLGWPVPVSVTLGYAIAFTVAFVLNRRFNFRSHAPVGGQIPRYVGVVAVNFGAILLGVTTGLSALGVQYQVARISAGALEGVFMFSAMRWYVFRTPAGSGAVRNPDAPAASDPAATPSPPSPGATDTPEPR